MASCSGDASSAIMGQDKTDLPHRAKSSDQILFCDICLEDEEEAIAVCYCQECNDYLRKDCKRGHVKNRLSRYHSILDADTMPNVKVAPKTTSNSFSQLESCKQHRQTLTHICLAHDEMSCELCIVAYHSHCDGVFPIMTVSNTEKDAAASQTLLTQIEDLQARFQICQRLSIKNAKKTALMYSKALATIKDILLALQSNDLIRMSSTSRACESILKDISSLKDYLETSQKAYKASQLYVAMRIAEKHISNLENTLETLDADNTISMFEFLPKKVKQGSEVNQNRVCLGQLVIYSGTIPYYEIKIESPTDNKNCVISDLHVLSTNLLFLVDNSNSKVKLVDTKKGKLTFELELLHCPVKAAKIDGTQFAVTQVGGRVQFMTAFLQTNMIITDTGFNTNGDCRGITYIPHIASLAVSFVNPGKIQIIDMAGNIMHTIHFENMTCPVHVLEMNEKLYVAETEENQVICMDLNGKVETAFTHNDQGILKPVCISKGPGTDMLIAFSGKLQILQVDRGLQNRETILGGQDWFLECSSVCFCIETKTLYVGTGEGKIKKYFIPD